MLDRGPVWLYALISVFSCIRSNQTDVVNVPCLFYTLHNVYTSMLCYHDF